MSRWGTILLLLLAIGAGVFLWVIEPRMRSTRETEAMQESLLGLRTQDIRGIRIRTGERSVEIELKDDGWWIGPDPRDRASVDRISELLTAAMNLRATDIIHSSEFDSRLDLDDFGLSEPKSQIDFIGDGKETLYFGKEASAPGKVYVRIGEAKDVFVVPDELQQLASVDPQEFRDRRLTTLTPDRIDRLVIKRGGGEIEIVRGARNWEITRPLRAPADSRRIETVLSEILGARISTFVAGASENFSTFGLTEPRAEIVMTTDADGKPLAVRIGADASTIEGGPGVIAQSSGRGGVYELPRVVLEALQVTPESLRDRRLLRLNPDTIDAIRVVRNGETETIDREEESWKNSAGVLPEGKVEAFIDSMNTTEVEEYIPLTPQSEQAAGLQPPQLVIHFDAWLSENTPEAVAGRHPVLDVEVGKVEDGRAWVRIDGAPEICVVPSAIVESLPAPGPPLNISAP